MKLVLLGTGGGPRSTNSRFPTSQAIIINDRLIVIDCGNGVTKQLANAGISPASLSHLLVTHHHVDHMADLGYLPLSSWIEGRTETVKVLGPPPTVQALDAILCGYDDDIEKRIISTGRPPFRPLLEARDLTQGGHVFEEDGIRVSCAIVDHPPFEIALAYRVDYNGKSIVISGDTAPSDELIELAQGADILVHEVVHPTAIAQMQKNTNAKTIASHMTQNHTMIEDVGKIATAANVKKLVLSHLVPHTGLTDEQWIEPVKPHFSGEIVVGHDLMEVPV